MRQLRSLLLMLTAVLLVATSVTIASASRPAAPEPGDHPARAKSSGSGKILTPSGNLGLTYRPLSGPCRVYDSRNTGGILSAASTRTITVKGSCGIPSTARQITGSLGSTGAAANGFFTGFAAGTQRPGVTVLNYAKDHTTSTGYTLPLKTGSGVDLAVYTSQKSHLILDVVGYYEEAMQAVVRVGPNAGLVTGTSHFKVLTNAGADGVAFVDVDRNIAGCTITSGSENTRFAVAAYPTTATRAYVVMRNTETDAYINELAHLTITC